MSILTKQQLEELNQSSFPDNSTEAITPAILRTYNTATIDTLVDSLDTGSFITSPDQVLGDTGILSSSAQNFNEFSSSVDGRLDSLESFSSSLDVTYVTQTELATASGSFLVTASFDNGTRNLTFTKGNSTQFSVNIPDASGSILPAGVVSGSSQINYPQISNIPSGIVSGSSQVSYTGLSNIPAGIVSGSSQVLGGTGILSSSNETFATFSQSVDSRIDALDLYTQSNDTKWNTLGSISGSWITNSQTSSMSVNFAVTSSKAQDLYVNAKNTTSNIITKGSVVRITGASGDNPEIGLADWTNDNFSANTLGIASADIPVNGFADIVVQGKMIGLNTNGFTAGQLVYLGASGSIVASVPPQYHEVRLGQVLRSNLNNGSIYLSVDNGYELTELHDVNIVTASLVNNDLLAYDSASQLWTNKSILGLGIPQLNTNNTFTGTNSFQNISAVSASFQYVQSVTGSAVIIGNSFVVVNNNTPTAPYGGLSVYDSGSVTPTTSSLVWDGNTNDWKYSYQVGVGHDAAVMLFGPGGNGLANTPYPTANKLQKGTGGHHLADSSISDDGTNVGIGANLQVTGSITTNGNAVLVNADLASLNSFTSSQQTINTALNASTASQQISIDNLNSFTSSQVVVNSNLNAFTQSQETKNSTLASYTASVDSSLSQLNSFTSSQAVVNSNLNAYTASNDTKWNTVGSQSGSWDNTQLNAFTASQQTLNTQLLTASSSFEAKFATIGTQSGSWGGGSGAGFPYTGSAVITGSLAITGSLSGYVNPLTITANTASLNFNDGNFFTLQLVSGSITHLTATNIKPGQTVNLLVKMDSVAGVTASSGSLTFSPTFKFAGGFDYTPTRITGSQDLVSFVTFDTTQILAAQVKNLS